MEDTQIELDYLRWFYQEAYFGPDDGDVRYYMNEQYVISGGVIPVGYKDEE